MYNQLVCNCHKDSRLLGVISLVEKVYSATSEEQQEEHGQQLQEALSEFLEEFVHHMEEEEKVLSLKKTLILERHSFAFVSQVFTPLLNENFETRELENMNEVVIRQHSLFREKVGRFKFEFEIILI